VHRPVPARAGHVHSVGTGESTALWVVLLVLVIGRQRGF
jgi:hypothetical protein